MPEFSFDVLKNEMGLAFESYERDFVAAFVTIKGVSIRRNMISLYNDGTLSLEGVQRISPFVESSEQYREAMASYDNFLLGHIKEEEVHPLVSEISFALTYIYKREDEAE